MKKKLLIYAHYYAPDVASTGQILKELAEGMKDAFDITAICVVPSYEGTVAEEYKKQRLYFEELNGIKLIRVRVPEFSKQNKVSRVKNIVSYFFGAMSATRKAGEQDYVYTISQPPILGGLLGVWGKWTKKAKYIYNIQDFNPEQVMAVSYSSNKLVIGLMMMLDKFSCKRADKVIVVGRDMMITLENRFKGKKAPIHTYINNWINEKEVYPLPKNHPEIEHFKKKYGIDNKFNIMYSGNIGLYYDLENLIRIMGKFKDRDDVVFTFVGEGAVKPKLEKYVRENDIKNIVFIPYQDKKKLIYSLNAADVHIVANAKGIKGVSVPSKIYGVMAVNVPALGILENGSEAWKIIEDSGCGVLCEAGDYNAIEKALADIIDEKQDFVDKRSTGREYMLERFTKDRSIARYKEEIRNL